MTCVCHQSVNITMSSKLNFLLEVFRSKQNLLLVTSMVVVSTIFVSVAVSYHLAMAGIKASTMQNTKMKVVF